jgi:hypothetical protein
MVTVVDIWKIDWMTLRIFSDCNHNEASGSPDDLLDPTHLPVVQPHFDAVGVKGRLREDVLDHAAGQFSGALVFFQYDVNFDSGSDVAAVRSFHSHLTLLQEILLFLFQKTPFSAS